jgi:DNA-binding CsgD family transcriptional regulator
MNGSVASTQGRGWPCLTPCERVIVELLALGFSNRSIAAQRGVSKHTVTKQLTALYTKLGVASRREFRALLGPRGAKDDEDSRARARFLSDREHQIVFLVGRGQSNKLIASALGLSISTVSTLLTRARRKLALATPAQGANAYCAPACDSRMIEFETR